MFRYGCMNPIAEEGLCRFPASAYEQTDKMEEAQGILVRSASLHDMDFSKHLLAIARAGAGVNNIPLDKCTEKGIVVFNTPGANANGVKELVFAGMLLASRDVAGGIKWVRDNSGAEDLGKKAEKEKKLFAGTELAGKKLGVVGLGAIGVRVANAAQEFDMEVYGYDPYVSVDAAWRLHRRISHVLKLEDIFEKCDIMTIHVPALPSTKGMISKEMVGLMKKDAILINMARDEVVDEKAVLSALDKGAIRCYVSDFPNPTVAGHKKCITTPHLGASTEESEVNCAIMAVDELRDYLENGNIRNSVNYPACSMGPCEAAGRVAVFHANKPGMLNLLSKVVGEGGCNITGMTSKNKGDVEYTMMDLDAPASETLKEKVLEIPGVFRVRRIR
ncbi:MAG: phosphoglycerate dehydrogenase [Lachnospiraceae bacterium]|nr:phosphoglycerate dehydrogenase [Lachnospiraceae bacterium]